jgi:hypothetical protein
MTVVGAGGGTGVAAGTEVTAPAQALSTTANNSAKLVILIGILLV